MAPSDQARRVTDWRREDGRIEGSPATGDGGQAALSQLTMTEHTFSSLKVQTVKVYM